MNDLVMFSFLLLIFISFFIAALVLKGKGEGKNKLSEIIQTGGIGSILAGTFFGVVKQVLLQKSIDGFYIFLIILLFFIWYITTKGISLGISVGFSSTKMPSNNKPSKISSYSDAINKTDDNIDILKDNSPKLSALTITFISIIGILIISILGISLYQKSKSGSGAPLMIYIIIITIMIILSLLFSFFSGIKITSQSKTEIMSYTISYAIIIGIMSSIFVFGNFILSTVITNTLIFFVWMTLTVSISNFLSYSPPVIQRN